MTDSPPMLRGKDRRYLRGLGNALRPTVYLGKEGLSAAVIRSLNEAYANSELVKVRLERGAPLDRREAGEQLAHDDQQLHLRRFLDEAALDFVLVLLGGLAVLQDVLLVGVELVTLVAVGRLAGNRALVRFVRRDDPAVRPKRCILEQPVVVAGIID